MQSNSKIWTYLHFHQTCQDPLIQIHLNFQVQNQMEMALVGTVGHLAEPKV